MSHAALGSQFHQLQMFATPHEVSQMKSGDYSYQPMSEVYKHDMVHGMETRRDDTERPHSSLPSYIDALNKSADKHGGFEVPIRVHHFTNGVTGEPDAVVMNGHHRALAAKTSNRLLPVIHSDYESGSSTYDAMKAGQQDEITRDRRLASERSR